MVNVIFRSTVLVNLDFMELDHLVNFYGVELFLVNLELVKLYQIRHETTACSSGPGCVEIRKSRSSVSHHTTVGKKGFSRSRRTS